MVKLVLGLTGSMGSGKDYVSEYLIKNYNFKNIGSGDYLRKRCEEEGLKTTRENAIFMYNKLVKKFGVDYVPTEVAKYIDSSNSDYVIFNGMRTRYDYINMKKYYGNRFVLLVVDTDELKRCNRMIKRGRVGDPKSFDDFKLQDDAEKKKYDLEYLFSKANITIDNNGTKKSFEKKIDYLIKNLLK